MKRFRKKLFVVLLFLFILSFGAFIYHISPYIAVLVAQNKVNLGDIKSFEDKQERSNPCFRKNEREC
jgi:hypothetical protein